MGAISRPFIDMDDILRRSGGERGIRTLGTLARSTVFETVPFNHSGTSPNRGRNIAGRVQGFNTGIACPAFRLSHWPASPNSLAYFTHLFQMIGQGTANEQPQRVERQSCALFEMHRAITFIVERVREEAAEVRDDRRLAMGIEGKAALFRQA